MTRRLRFLSTGNLSAVFRPCRRSGEESDCLTSELSEAAGERYSLAGRVTFGVINVREPEYLTYDEIDTALAVAVDRDFEDAYICMWTTVWSARTLTARRLRGL